MRLLHGASALCLFIMPVGATAVAAVPKKPGSLHVQCDGMPNNVTSGETAARLLGAVTLLGLFATPPESADASKRKFGAEGVATCSTLIAGERLEGNPERRLGLILARAIHQIEAKNYDAALADVAFARREVAANVLIANVFFQRSRGRALDLIESAALVRLGRAPDASTAASRGAAAYQYSISHLLATPTYEDVIAVPSPGELELLRWRMRIAPMLVNGLADRLILAGKYAEAATAWDAFAEYDAEQTPEFQSSMVFAQAALAHALAGNADIAAERAKSAQANFDTRKAAGKPETGASEFVETLDLYNIIRMAATNPKGARRLFAARSQWLSAPLGSVLEVNRRLRQGAAPDELIGGMARDSDTMWKEQAETARAALMATDGDNKTLFRLLPPARTAKDYFALSPQIWRVDKSRMLIKSKSDPTKNRMELLYMMSDPTLALEAYVLHAALIAKSRGHHGFVFMPILSDKIVAGSFRTGNRGQKGFAPSLFIDVDDAIARLIPIFPNNRPEQATPATN